MWDPVKGSVHVTCDVVWLKKMYYKEQEGGETLVLEPTSVDVQGVKWAADEDVPVRGGEDIANGRDENQGETEEAEGWTRVRSKGETRYRRKIKKPTLYGFDTGFTVRLTPAEERFYREMSELQELSLFTLHMY